VTPFYGMEEMETDRSEKIANSSREFALTMRKCYCEPDFSIATLISGLTDSLINRQYYNSPNSNYQMT
jgi:hypothetical protein